MDKETIIKGCENWVNNHKGENLLLTYSSVVELLAVLKEQEAVEPKKAPFPDASRSDGSWFYICGACSRAIDPKDKYCRECGRPVLWEGR